MYVVLNTIEYYVNKVYFAFVEQNENKILFYSHVNTENVKQRGRITVENRVQRPTNLFILKGFQANKGFFCHLKNYMVYKNKYRKDSCISRTFLLKFWAKNHGCGLYTRPFLSERVNWLVVVTN